MSKTTRKKGPAMMLGLGLDNDGHKRLTVGSNFLLMGGGENTHAEMTEKVVKINEHLHAKGKRLEDLGSEEFDDLAHSVGLRRAKPDKEKGSAE